MANKILPVADALKQLYEALGGDDPEVLELSTNTELIQEIAKVAPSGGSGLPEVTDVDEGKVLTVDSSGEWAAEDKSVIFHVNMGEDGPTGLQESFNQMVKKSSYGRPIAIVENDVDTYTFFHADAYYTDSFSVEVSAGSDIWTFIAPDNDADAPMIYD